MKTITLEEAQELAGIKASKWNDRYYFNANGAVSKAYWMSGKVYFQMGKGRDSSEALEMFARLIGCNVTDRYSKSAGYVVL